MLADGFPVEVGVAAPGVDGDGDGDGEAGPLAISEPKKGASPKAKMPPSAPTIQ